MGKFLLTIALAGTLLLSLHTRKVPLPSEDDLRVLLLLLALLLSASAIDESRLLNPFLGRLFEGKLITTKLTLAAALLGALITNDGALLLLLPPTLKVKVQNRGRLIALETLGANVGSALTPFGNPQNLFIYHHFDLNIGRFLTAVLPLFIVGIAIALLISLLTKENAPPSAGEERAEADKILGTLALLSFTLSVGASLELLPTPAVILAALLPLLRPALLRKIELNLFITIGVLMLLSAALEEILKFSPAGGLKVYLTAVALSQLVGNVPAAVLLSAATSDYAALLLGVNAGGLGLPTASIANLLGYRAAASEVEKKEFLKLSLGVGFVVQTLCGIFLNLLR